MDDDSRDPRPGVGGPSRSEAETEPLRNVSGAVYLPQKDWNAYQMWANYENAVVERDLGYAATLGLNSLRVFASYEYWREDGPAFFAHVEHFLSTCESRGIRPIVVLFEAPPEDPPTEENLHATDPGSAFGVHSPSRPEILQPRNWSGYARSPVHFARRWAQEFAEDDRLLATEIMNEPGEVQPRRDFVLDALRTVRTTAPDATLTMGTKDVRYAAYYDDPDALGSRAGSDNRAGPDSRPSPDDHRGLDAYQFHMNLPSDPDAAAAYAAEQRRLADDIGPRGESKPLWCTEWQRTLEEPPTRFAPDLASLGPTMREVRRAGTIDGDFFWSLMLKPAYLREPRWRGRVNGLFHADGAVYSRLDAEVVAGEPLDLTGRQTLPASWRTHRFPYPGSSGGRPGASGGQSADYESKSDGIGRESEPDGIGDFDDLLNSLEERVRRALGVDSDE